MTDQAEELRALLQRLFRRFGALAHDATPCGKPLPVAHAHALMILEARGEMTQQALASELCIDKSNVARLCARMVELGHATQRVGEHDARSRRVALTSQGKRVAREVETASRARFQSLLEGVSPRYRRVVLVALRELLLAVEKLPRAGMLDLRATP